MYRKTGVLFAVIVTLLLVVAAVGFSAPRGPVTDDQMAARVSARHSGGHLDQDYNQLRYVKTTDFGATWAMGQAGDLSTFAPYDAVTFGDFSAVTMANGELCYLIALESATPPGIYALTGPSFAPHQVMAEGSNDLFAYGYVGGPGHAGHTDIGRAPNGNLVGIFWGNNASGANTVWACKSTNNGVDWTSWVIATEPALPANSTDFGWFKMPDRVSNQWAWTVYQIPAAAGQWDIKVIRFDHTTTNAGTIVPVDYSGHQYSFMFGGLKPIAYDPAADWLYVAFRNHDVTGVLVYASHNGGASFSQEANVTAPGQRYPSMSMRGATQTPWMVYGETTSGLGPGDQQCAFDSYDEIGYGGASWIDPAVSFQCVTLYDTNTAGWNAIYFPQAWWWDATHGACSFNGYTDFLSGEVIETDRTTDGGATWVDMGTRMHYLTDLFNAATMQPPEIVGGDNGLAYVIFSGSHGVTDTEGPSVGAPELLTQITPPTDPNGPYAVRAYYSDNVGIDISNPNGAGPWVNWGDHTGVTVAYANQDSQQVDANNNGWYYFTIPDTALGGISQGDSIFFYCDGYDVSGFYKASLEEIIVAGVAWLDVYRPSNGRVTEYALLGNYPNPFNPSTNIQFNLPVESEVTLGVYNTLGQLVRTVADREIMGAGTHGIVFDASDLPSGVYLYRLTAGSFTETRKMLLVK